MSPLEVEVKFLSPDLRGFRSLLVASGGKLAKSRTFQRNVVFDTADDALLRRGELLRLRQDTEASITFKGVPEREAYSEAKVHIELETQVGSFKAASAILERLGFTPKRVYEKHRETFEFGETEVVLDEMPFGDFIELEGDEAGIKQAAKTLGLDWRKRITSNYLELMELMKAQYALPFDDLTFANFQEVPYSINELLMDTVWNREEN
jgi:adenylate cyclase class 2